MLFENNEKWALIISAQELEAENPQNFVILRVKLKISFFHIY
jgi:hypothetical protein